MEVRACLVDDDDLIRGAITTAFARKDHGVVVTAFGKPSEVLAAVDRGEIFDVALVDLGLPEVSGQVLIRELRRRCETLPVLAFTVREDDSAVFSALGAGAVGYITKMASTTELVGALQSAMRGGGPLSPSVSGRVVAKFWSASSPLMTMDADLTAREREVLELLCNAASYREVALLLGISEGTVQTHIKRIYSKLGVSSKADAVRMVLGRQDRARV